MNKQVKEKWLAALRSGEYKQTKHTLKNDQGFCCLGVLCDVYAKENQDPIWETGNLFGGVLPECVLKWAGLDGASPRVREQFNGHDTLPITLLNDELEGYNFNRLADVIERDL